MKAIMIQEYGKPEMAKVCELPIPEINGNELLIAIKKTTVSSGDARIRSLNVPTGFRTLVRLVFGWQAPKKPLGTEFSGTIEKVGANTKLFKPGDVVFGYTGHRVGCHAEFIAISEKGCIAKIPEHLSLAQAASVSFGGMTALDFLVNKAKISKDEKLLIIGASGCVGSAALQIAKHRGAHVTGVCGKDNVNQVKELGADIVIDYSIPGVDSEFEKYDVIFDTVGVLPISLHRSRLTPQGRLVLVVGGLGTIIIANLISIMSKQTILSGDTSENVEDFQTLTSLVDQHAFIPLIDSEFELEEISKAYERVDTGRKRGSVVINVKD